MKRLIVIVEGQTEKEFVEKSVRDFFYKNYNIYDIRAIMIQTSKGHKGGFLNYMHLKNDINKILNSEKEVIVTMFVDFFKLPTNFPKTKDTINVISIDNKIDILELGIKEDINNSEFVPYIQKHEFEALLFSSGKGFNEWFDDEKIIENLNNIVEQYPNPEEINTGSETSPSKRIMKILDERNQKYDKIAEGNLIAEEIGFDIIMNKCPRFRKWILNLGEKLKKE
jgi:hypothetical protein